MRARSGFAAAALAAIGVVAAPVQAAEYPERTVDLTIPYAAGGGIDLLLRALALVYAPEAVKTIDRALKRSA